MRFRQQRQIEASGGGQGQQEGEGRGGWHLARRPLTRRCVGVCLWGHRQPDQRLLHAQAPQRLLP